MKIYHYHPDSAAYIGDSVADESPLEPGVFLIPAHATVVPPPAVAEGEQALFTGATWILQPIPQPPAAAAPSAPLTEAQLAVVTIDKRDRLLADATLAMAPLQDAVELDDATPAELALLKQWKQYRVALNRVPQQDDFPHAITWPVAPNAAAL